MMVVTFEEYCYSRIDWTRSNPAHLRSFSDGFSMKKAVWISFAISLVLVNLIAEIVFYFTGTNIVMLFRITLILGITTITAIFVGAIMLVSKLEEEVPLSGHVRNTLGADKKKS